MSFRRLFIERNSKGDVKISGIIQRIKIAPCGDIYFTHKDYKDICFSNRNKLFKIDTSGTVQEIKTNFPVETFCLSPEGKLFYSTSSQNYEGTDSNTQIWEIKDTGDFRLIGGSSSRHKFKPINKGYYNGNQVYAVFNSIKDMYYYHEDIIILEKGVLRKVDVYDGLTMVINDQINCKAESIVGGLGDIFVQGPSTIEKIDKYGHISEGMEGEFRFIVLNKEETLFIGENQQFSTYDSNLECITSKSDYDKILEDKIIHWTKMEDGKIIGNYVTSIDFGPDNEFYFSTDQGIYQITF